MSITTASTSSPDLSIEDGWGEFVAGRYREGKSESEFRNYDAAVVPTVAEFYQRAFGHDLPESAARVKVA